MARNTARDSTSAAAVSFNGFVVSLATTAAVHFGDVPDPGSGEKGPANLPAAGQAIAMLALLEEKTRGNLTAEETRFLRQVLHELRLRLTEARMGTPGAVPGGNAPSAGGG
ncbi:MAG: DUF1844 domain-containing protein [Acidobacteria bacterium]|nr:DUF1844 domain-containing protein [Acidobacteriota bacterium]